jgi:hypothetical protein
MIGGGIYTLISLLLLNYSIQKTQLYSYDEISLEVFGKIPNIFVRIVAFINPTGIIVGFFLLLID